MVDCSFWADESALKVIIQKYLCECLHRVGIGCVYNINMKYANKIFSYTTVKFLGRVFAGI